MDAKQTSPGPSSKSVSSPRPAAPPKPGAAQMQNSRLDINTVKSMFPRHYQGNAEAGYKLVEKAFADHLRRSKLNLAPDQIQTLRLYLYATIRAETNKFSPHDEPANATNSYTYTPYEFQNLSDTPIPLQYGKYVRRSLRNETLVDAQLYHGRGYIQLTGWVNYAKYGPAADLKDLVHSPSQAAEPEPAAKLAVAYVLHDGNRNRILQALARGDMAEARAVTNGRGIDVRKNEPARPNGLRDFKRAYLQGIEAIDPVDLSVRTRALEATLQGDPNRT